jgi:hypothetical protein
MDMIPFYSLTSSILKTDYAGFSCHLRPGLLDVLSGPPYIKAGKVIEKVYFAHPAV